MCRWTRPPRGRPPCRRGDHGRPRLGGFVIAATRTLPALGAPPTGGNRGARHRIVERTIEVMAERGVADVSLRELAGALGTSHRMLIYHFGSKEGLFIEVVRAVEERQRASFSELVDQDGGSLVEVSRRFWRQVSDPALAPHERLFFELYGQALQGRPYAAAFLDGIVDSWVAPMSDLLQAEGFTEDEARNEARLGIAVVRGLLLDLLATGDLEGATAAFESYLTSVPPPSRRS